MSDWMQAEKLYAAEPWWLVAALHQLKIEVKGTEIIQTMITFKQKKQLNQKPATATYIFWR